MSAGETTPHAKHNNVRPRSPGWWHYIKVRNIVFGLVVFGLGLGSYFIPLPFGLKDLLSGAILGTGMATILAEFTFAFERRGSDVNQRVLTEQNQNLIQNIDLLKSSITKPQVYQNSHLFSLGTSIALIQWQKNALAQSQIEEDETQLMDLKNHLMSLAGVLGLRSVIEQFINQPDLQAPEAMPAFKAVKDAVKLRYPREGLDTYVTGYLLTSWLCGVIGDFDASTLETVRKGMLALNLRLDVENYVEDGLLAYKTGKCPRRNLIGFLSLLGLYIIHLTVGSNLDIVTFFEKEHLPVEKEATAQRMLELLQKEMNSGANITQALK